MLRYQICMSSFCVLKLKKKKKNAVMNMETEKKNKKLAHPCQVLKAPQGET